MFLTDSLELPPRQDLIDFMARRLRPVNAGMYLPGPGVRVARRSFHTTPATNSHYMPSDSARIFWII